VSFDGVAENRAFAEKCSFPFPLLCDTGREVGVAYGAAADQDAGSPKRISYLIGPAGEVLKAYPKVSPASHPEEVLHDLALLHKGPARQESTS
jgi:peroxiredoxin Q/BCP